METKRPESVRIAGDMNTGNKQKDQHQKISNHRSYLLCVHERMFVVFLDPHKRALFEKIVAKILKILIDDKQGFILCLLYR